MSKAGTKKKKKEKEKEKKKKRKERRSHIRILVPEGWHEASPTLNTNKYWAPWYNIYLPT